MKDAMQKAWSSAGHATRKLLAASVLLGFMALLAFIQYENNVRGGHSFSQTAADEQMWALTFTALLGLLGLFSMVRAVLPKHEKKARRGMMAFICSLAFVLGVGGFAGRMATTKNADLKHSADSDGAAALVRQAEAIRRVNDAKIAGLESRANDLSASAATRNAARDQLDSVQANLEKAAKLEQQAAAIRGESSVTSDEIFNGFIGLFFGLIQVCIELGFAVCCHYFALLFGGQIRSLFNNLRYYDEHGGDETAAAISAAKEAAETAAKKPPQPAQNSRDDMTVQDWVKAIRQAAKSNPDEFVSSRGLIKREAVRAMEGGSSFIAERAYKIVNQQRRKAA